MTNNYLTKIIMMQIIPTFPTHLYAIIGHYSPLLVIIRALYYEMGHYSIKNKGRIMPYNGFNFKNSKPLFSFFLQVAGTISLSLSLLSKS